MALVAQTSVRAVPARSLPTRWTLLSAVVGSHRFLGA